MFNLPKGYCTNEPEVNQAVQKTATRASLIPVFIHLTALPFQTFRYKQDHHTLQRRRDENQRMANRGNQQLLASHTANYVHSSWEHNSFLDTSSHSLITNSHYPTSRDPGPPLEAYSNFLDLSEFSRALEEIPPGNDYTDRHFEDENCVGENPTPYLRPFQDHKR